MRGRVLQQNTASIAYFGGRQGLLEAEQEEEEEQLAMQPEQPGHCAAHPERPAAEASGPRRSGAASPATATSAAHCSCSWGGGGVRHHAFVGAVGVGMLLQELFELVPAARLGELMQEVAEGRTWKGKGWYGGGRGWLGGAEACPVGGLAGMHGPEENTGQICQRRWSGRCVCCATTWPAMLHA